MNKYIALIFAGVALVLASCSKHQPPSLVGRWLEVGTSGVVVFHKDDTVEISIDGTITGGKYSFISDSELKIEVVGKLIRVFQMTINGDKMTLTDMDGQKSEYLRAKMSTPKVVGATVVERRSFTQGRWDLPCRGSHAAQL
jgi:hypothetical protein